MFLGVTSDRKDTTWVDKQEMWRYTQSTVYEHSLLSLLQWRSRPWAKGAGGVVVSRPWAKGVARFLFFCLPCRLFFLVRFFFTQNKKGGGGRARALRPPSPGSATVLYWLSARERYVILGKLSQSHLILRPENSGFIVMTWCTYANILIFKEV